MPPANVSFNQLSNGSIATEKVHLGAVGGISKLQYSTIEDTIESFSKIYFSAISILGFIKENAP